MLITSYWLKNILIREFKSGFRPGDSTVNQLISISNDFGKAIDDGKEIRRIFCDVSKAFDRFWHKGPNSTSVSGIITKIGQPPIENFTQYFKSVKIFYIYCFVF